MLSYDVVNEFFGFLVLFRGAFYEDIPQVGVGYLFLCDLNLCTALLLKIPDGLASLADDKSDAIIWDRDNIGIRRGRSIRSHHAIIHGIYCRLLCIVELGSNCELLLPDFIPGRVICGDDSINGVLSSSDIFGRIPNNQDMLLVFIIRLRSRPFLLRALAADQDLAAGLFFESLLVQALGPYEHADVVDSGVLWEINLLFNF